MTIEEKLNQMKVMLDISSDEEDSVLMVYLNLAQQKILNHRFPYGTTLVEIEQQYEYDQIELAIVLYNQRGAEGQVTHNENGVNRTWRTEHQILKGIPRMVGIPK